MRIDLHTHSRVSDGTDSPSELVEKAKTVGLDVVALTDHDTFDGLPEAHAAADQVGIVLVPGVELSTEHQGADVHLLGYFTDPNDAALSAELERVRRSRRERVPQMVDRLAALGYPITLADVEAQSKDAVSPGRPHVADALVAAGLVKDRSEAFDDLLHEGGPAYVARYRTPLADMIDLVVAAGGVPVVAHVWGRGRPVSAAELADLVREHHLAGIEVDHQLHDAETRAELRALASDLGVIVTGSSDYHGTGKIDHDLGCNTTAPDMLGRLYEAAGVRPPLDLRG